MRVAQNDEDDRAGYVQFGNKLSCNSILSCLLSLLCLVSLHDD